MVELDLVLAELLGSEIPDTNPFN
jgi:hypothetical protein